MKNLKIKVCGMRETENIAAIALANPDYFGFIFYPKSKRFVGFETQSSILESVSEHIQKAGVFVDDDSEKILQVAHAWNLQVIQLHGNESPADCQKIKENGLTIFKAFSVDDNFNFDMLASYEEYCDYFLFDTKGTLPGGTGQKFNWQLLQKYQGKIPFFLSGGIGPGDVQSIRAFHHPQLFGIDINSGFELAPAMKNIEKVRRFIEEIRNIK